MKSIIVKAIFRGQDGSCGYETNKEYELLVDHSKDTDLWIQNNNTDGYRGEDGYCEYGSVISFFENWDNIRRI